MSRREEELETLVGDGGKRRGCCTARPKLCVGVLLVTAAVCVAVVACGASLHAMVDEKVQDAIAEVRLR